ncbi:MAG: RNA-directed DNA polymerase [Candidatus Pacebacteria bacterium]|nr:RNA-directed DNA polymerase [Candidatus Paceibacterota bacterium]
MSRIVKAYKDLDDIVVFEKLICFGLFPEKIKDILTSEQYGQWVINNKIKKYLYKKKQSFSPVAFKLTRNNNIPRVLSIPHPVAYTELCFCIKDNWNNINKTIGKVSNYPDTSIIVPKLNNKNGRLVSFGSYGKNKQENFIKLQKQSGKKYVVFADISNCFSSIYSHSISWALAGKKEAKKNRNDKKKWYNELDYYVRRMKNDETSGILIGPDTSNVISEIILSAVDKELSSYSYVRYIDDYICYCESLEKANSFIKDLSGNLDTYCLGLNSQKTEILELPLAQSTDWINLLQEFSEANLNKILDISQKNKIISFLDLATTLFKNGNNTHSIKYAMKMLSCKYYLDYDSYRIVLKYFGNLTFLYPYNIDSFDKLFSIGNALDEKKFKKDAEDIIELLLNEHIYSRKSDIMAWTLFLAIKYDLAIKNLTKKRNAIILSRDCVPTLMFFAYDKCKGNDYKNYYYKIIRELIKDDVQSEWWIYIYEVFRSDQKKFRKSFRKALADGNVNYFDFYEKMAKDGVSFLNVIILDKL